MKYNKTKRLLFFTITLFIISIMIYTKNTTANENAVSEITSITETADGAVTSSDLENIETAAKITLNGSTITIDGSGATTQGSTLTITGGGAYILSGTLTNGQIVVAAPKTADVQLILNGVDITSDTNAAIYGMQANRLMITLAEGSQNTLTDAQNYSYANVVDEEPDAALFSKGDLTLNGQGALTINAGFNNGIGTKDNLVIESGTYQITAANHGIRGRDSLTILGGNFVIQAGSDGIQSNNDEDTSKGWIMLEAGTLNITAGNDGIQAETALTVTGGDYTILAGEGNTAVISDSTASYKGMKAGTTLTINGGNFEINSADDSIHSNADIVITGGTFSLITGDDGIHADGDMSISDGNILIHDSYEGIEAATMTLSGGIINLAARDDGINVAGGNDTGQGGFGYDRFASGDQWLHITNGDITVDAQGDGIDVNGDMEMSGGTVLINGPTNNGNGALDFDGTFNLTGGTLMAAGSYGMAQTPSNSSSQMSLMLVYTSGQEAGTTVVLAENDVEKLSFTPTKPFQMILISSSDMQEGAAYAVKTGGNTVNITLTDLVTAVSETGEAVPQRGGGMGGQRPGGRR